MSSSLASSGNPEAAALTGETLPYSEGCGVKGGPSSDGVLPVVVRGSQVTMCPI